MMQLIIETDRLYLKTIGTGAAGRLLDYYQKNRSFLQEWEPYREEAFFTVEFQEYLLSRDLEEMYKGNMVKLWIYKKENQEKMIGMIAFNNIVRGVFLSCHLGYRLDKDETGKGYMNEALSAGIDYVFNYLLLHRIEANIMPRNKSSLAVVRRLGFYEEGLALKYLKINGKWEDHIHMVLLNDKV